MRESSFLIQGEGIIESENHQFSTRSKKIEAESSMVHKVSYSLESLRGFENYWLQPLEILMELSWNGFWASRYLESPKWLLMSSPGHKSLLSDFKILYFRITQGEMYLTVETSGCHYLNSVIKFSILVLKTTRRIMYCLMWCNILNDDYKIENVVNCVKFHVKLQIITVWSATKERYMMTGEGLMGPDLDKE